MLAMQMHVLKAEKKKQKYNPRQRPTAAWEVAPSRQKIWHSKKHKAKTVMIHVMAIEDATAPVSATKIHRGGAVPARPGPGRFVFDMHCQ